MSFDDSRTTWNFSVQSGFSDRFSIRVATPSSTPAAGTSTGAPVWSTYRPSASVYTLSHSSCVTWDTASSFTTVSGTCWVRARRRMTW